MGKINDKFKRDLDKFNKSVDKVKQQKIKTERPTDFTKGIETDINSNVKRLSGFNTGFKIKLDEQPTGVSDRGFDQDSLNNSILYNSNMTDTAPKKMRRIVTSQKNSNSSQQLFNSQSKMFSKMFTSQGKLSLRLHAERLAIDNKFHTSTINYLDKISKQVEQINQSRNTITMDFYKNSLNTSSQILEELKTLNKNLKTGFNLNDNGEKVYDRNTESLIRGLFSGGNFRGQAKKIMMQLARDSLGMPGTSAAMALSALLPIIQQRGGGRTLATMGMKMGLTAGANKLLSGTRGGRRINNMIQNPGEFFEAMMNSWALSGNGLKQWFGKKLGNNKKFDYKFDFSKFLNPDMKGRATFDNAAHTALTRVITRSLANIEATLTGNEAVFYNYNSNRYETIEQAKATLKDGYSDAMKKELEYARKELLGGNKKEKRNKIGTGTTEYVDEGIFSKLLKIEDPTNIELNFIKKMIKLRGEQLADAMMKLMLFLSRNNTNSAAILDNGDLPLTFLVERILYPDQEAFKKLPKPDREKIYQSADHFKRFLEAFRGLPNKVAQEQWQALLRQAETTREKLVRSTDEAFKEAEGSTAAWAAFSYGTVTENGRTRGKTRDELDKELEYLTDPEYAKDNTVIDMSGVQSKEELQRRLAEQYNKMLAPLFAGVPSKIKSSLKAKAKQLESQDHMFAPYVRKLADAFEKVGDISFDQVDYAQMSGLTYEDLTKHQAPKFNGYDMKTSIESAKDIAKWHMENNPKARAMVGVGAAAGVGALVKMLYEKSGMTGPFASSILGISAAATLTFSGKMSKMVDIMTTSVGDEKMKDKNGNETDVTKREAMQEAMYREFLPQSLGFAAGAKIGGWVRNNVRFGPILGPVVGMTTGLILAKSSGMLVKIFGLFGKFAKFMLNRLGRKLTGNKSSNWGDVARDFLRAKMGLPPVASKFTMKDVMKQTGDPKASKLDNFFTLISGRFSKKTKKNGPAPVTAPPKVDIETRLREAQARVAAMKKANENYKSVYGEGEEDPEGKKPLNAEHNKIPVMNVKVIGGHLDAIGVIGAVDAEAYSKKMKEMAQKTTTETNEENPDAPQAEKQAAVQAVNQNLAAGDSFMKQDPEAKDEAEDQDEQEKIEEKNEKNIETIAKNGVGNSKEKPEKKKKKGLFGSIVDIFTGNGELSDFANLAKGLLGGVILFPLLKQFLPKVGDIGKWAWKEFNPMALFNKAKDTFNFTADHFYQKKQKGDVLPDGKISLGIDLFRFLRDPKSQKLVAGVLKAFIPKPIKAIGGAVKSVGKAVLGKAKDVAKNVVEKVAEGGPSKFKKIGEWALKAADLMGKLMKKIPGMKNIAEKIGESFIPAVKDLVKKLVEKCAEQGAEFAEKKFVKGAIGFLKEALTAGTITAVLNIGFIAWDAWQGAKKAKEFFGLDENDQPSAIQKWSCALTYGLLSLIESIPGCMIITNIVSALDFIMRWLCHKMYELLNGLLTPLGMGESAEELEQYRILIQNDDEDKSKDGNKIDGKNKSDEVTGQQGDSSGGDGSSGNTSGDTSVQSIDGSQDPNGDAIKEAFKYYGTVGGSGGGTGVSYLNGKSAKGNVPTFISQSSLPAGMLGSLNIQDDGCSLAVMKMIAAHKGLNLDDKTLMSKMHQYSLANKSVSVSFFDEFGGRSTMNKEDIRNTLLSGSAVMALLVSNSGAKHFVAVIAKDRSTVYVGDPLKDGWEEMPNTDNKLLAYAIAASIFDGGIVTGIGTPGKMKQGGTGVGGFGSTAKAITLQTMNAIKEGGKKIGGSMVNIFNNGGDYETVSSGTTNNTTTDSTPITGDYNYVRRQQRINEGGWYDGSKGGGKTLFGIDGKTDAYARNKYGINEGNVADMPWSTAEKIWHDVYDASGLAKVKSPQARFAMFDIAGHGPALVPTRAIAALHKQNVPYERHGTEYTTKNELFVYSDSLINAINQLQGDKAKQFALDINSEHWSHYGYGKTRLKGNANYINTGEPGYGDGSKTFKYRGVTYGADGPIGGGTTSTNSNQGGKGGPKKLAVNSNNLKVEKQIFGRGIGMNEEIIRNCFVKQSAVGKALGLNGNQNSTCGLAVALMVLKIVYYSDRTKFDAKSIKSWADQKKLFDKDLGVSQRFFIGLGMHPIDMGKIKNQHKGQFPRVSYFCSNSSLDSKTYSIKSGELAAMNIGSHWVLAVKTMKDKCWILDPMKDSASTPDYYANIEVHYMCSLETTADLVNILTHKAGGKASGGMGSGAPGDPTATNPATDANTTTDANGNAVESTPNRGTSATFGGWFYKDANGEWKQIMFGNRVKKVAGAGQQQQNNNNGAPAATGPAGPLGLLASCDVVPLPKKDGGNVPKDSKAYKLGEMAVKLHGNSTMKGKCLSGVAETIARTFKVSHESVSAEGANCMSAGKFRNGKSDDASAKGKFEKLGFEAISCTSVPQVGDILVFNDPRVEGWYGHITMLAANGKWISDGVQNDFYVYRNPTPRSNHPKYGTSKTSKPTDAQYTMWRLKEGIGGDPVDDLAQDNTERYDVKLESKTGTVQQYYSKGSKSYNTEYVYNEMNKKIQADKNTPGFVAPEGYVLATEAKDKDGNTYKTFVNVNDPKRNASLEYRDYTAKAKYDREMRKRNEDKNIKNFGVMKATYKNQDEVIDKSLTTTYNAISDVKSNNKLISTLSSLTAQIMKNTQANKAGVKSIVEEKEKQSDLIKKNIDATKSIQETTEKSVKDNIDIVNKINPITAEEIKAQFSLIRQAEKEMFAGLTN